MQSSWFASESDRVARPGLWRFQALVLGVVVLIVFTAVFFRRGGALILRDYTHAEGGYRLRFPAGAVALCRVDPTPEGPMRVFIRQYQDRRLYCAVGYGDRPPSTGADTPGSFLDGMVRLLAETCRGRVETDTRFAVDDRPARRLHLTAADDVVVDALLVLAGQRVYQVVVATHRRHPQPRTVEAILGSFHLTSSGVGAGPVVKP